MEIKIVQRSELKALTIKVACNGHEVRKGWHALQKKLDGQTVKDLSHGYVFVPEWQWKTGVNELWVGVELESYKHIPEGTVQLILPARTYACVTVKGDRKTMYATYDDLNQWIRDNGYERDTSEGSYSIEANPLTPVNPFDIPADVIEQFDFVIYAPIKM